MWCWYGDHAAQSMSKAFTGYSYSENPDDYITGDAQTAQDNYELIQAFMDRFPEYRQNDLYISSESYGGHYMPTLAKQIVDENSAGQKPALNFKGFAVGNPYTDVNSGTPAMMETFWGHQLVAKPTWDEFSAKCTNGKLPHPKDCLALTAELNEQVGNLNPYGEICHSLTTLVGDTVCTIIFRLFSIVKLDCTPLFARILIVSRCLLASC